MHSSVHLIACVLLCVVVSHHHCGGLVLPLTHHKSTVTTLKAGPYVFPIEGNINQYAEFFVNVSIGTPPQILRLQVDTGSTDLVVYGTHCNGCPKTDNTTYYDTSKSKSVSIIDCHDDRYDCNVNNCWMDSWCPMDIEYGGGGSIQGYAVLDTIEVAETGLKARASVGVIEDLRGPFENLGVDGCWGFAYSELSSWGDTCAQDHLALENKFYNSFSLCLTPQDPVMDMGTNYQADSRFEWTKVTEQIWYSVHMDDLLVNNKSLGFSNLTLNADGVIVDSGTTLVIVSKKMMAAITTALTDMCATGVDLVGVCNATKGQSLFDGYCFDMTDQQVSQFPPISISLRGLQNQLVMPPTAYLWEGAGEEGVFCLGLQALAGAEIPVILGDILMQNYHVVFDRHTNTVGWGPLSSCPTPTTAA